MSELTRTTTLLLEGLLDPNNREAWRTLHDRCRPMLIAYGRRYGLQDADAEDAAQEALADFARAYQAGQYDRGRGPLRHWLAGFAARRVAKVGSARRAPGLDHPDKTQALAGAADSDSGSLDQIWEEEWERHVLQLCLSQVRMETDPKHVEAFEMYALGGCSVAETAQAVGVTENVVYIAKTRILSRLRALREELEARW